MKLKINTLNILCCFCWDIFSRFFFLCLLFRLRKGKVWIHKLGSTQGSSSEMGRSPHTSVANLKHSWLRVQLFSRTTVQHVRLCSVSPDEILAGGESCSISGSEMQERMSEKCHSVSNHRAETLFYLFFSRDAHTMMRSKTVTCNDCQWIRIKSIEGPGCVGMMHPCKWYQSGPVLIKDAACMVAAEC